MATGCMLAFVFSDTVLKFQYIIQWSMCFSSCCFADIRQSRSQVRERTGNDPVIERVLALMRENSAVKYM